MQTTGTIETAGRLRGGGLGLLLAVIMLGLCWAVPSNAIPLAWFGVEEFDTRAVPVLASERLASADATAAADDASRSAQPPDASQCDDAFAVDVAPVPTAVLVSCPPGCASPPELPPVASSYHARAPPALS